MPYDPNIQHRRSLRLRGFDYSQPGVYFLTIATQKRQCLFGDIVGGEPHLNQYGEIVREEWEKSSHIRSEILLDEFVLMPNHLHGIVMILPIEDRMANEAATSGGPSDRSTSFTSSVVVADTVGANGRSPLLLNRPPGIQPRSLGSFVAGFKSAAASRINNLRGTPGTRIWQRNYYEHVIRHERSLYELRSYIATNGAKWELDQLHPDNPSRW